MEIFGIVSVPTNKLPKFQLTPQKSLYCFATQQAANAFMLQQLQIAHERGMLSWTVPGSENDEKPVGLGMACVRYTLDVPAELVEERTREWEGQQCPDGYLGRLRASDMFSPQVSAYFLGKDFKVREKSQVTSYSAETNIAELVQARKEKYTRAYEALLESKKRVAEARAERAERKKAKQAEKTAQRRAEREQEQRSWDGSDGMKLIQQHLKELSATEAYAVFSRNLIAAFKNHAKQSRDDESKMTAANKALADVFGQVQKCAVRREDSEMEAVAKGVVDAANDFLAKERRNTINEYQEQESADMSREDFGALGIYIPDER